MKKQTFGVILILCLFFVICSCSRQQPDGGGAALNEETESKVSTVETESKESSVQAAREETGDPDAEKKWLIPYGNTKKGFYDNMGDTFCGPDYIDIRKLSTYDAARDSSRYVPMYLALIGGTTTSGDDAPAEDAPSYRLFSEDGSYISEEEYGYVFADKDGVICMETYDSDSFVKCDFDGNVILTSGDIMKANAGKFSKASEYEWNSLCYDGGVYTIYINGVLYDMDPVSLKVTGKHEDTFYVDLPDGSRLFIDEEVSKGKLFDNTGKLIRTFDGITGAKANMYGFETFVFDAENDRFYENVYDCAGRQLYSAAETDVSVFDTCHVIAGYVEDEAAAEALKFCAFSDNMCLFDMVTGKILYLPDTGYCYTMNTADGHADLPYIQAVDYNGEDCFRLIDMDLNIVMEGEGTTIPVQDRINNLWYLVVEKEDRFSLFDRELTLVADKLKAIPEIYGSILSVTNGSETEGIKNGTVFFRYEEEEL